MPKKAIRETKEQFLSRVTQVVKYRCEQYFKQYCVPLKFNSVFCSWATGAKKHNMSTLEVAYAVAEHAGIYIHSSPQGWNYLLPRRVLQNQESLDQAIDCMVLSKYKTFDPRYLEV